MDASTREMITWTLGTTVTLIFLTSLAVKFILMPYLQTHLVKPVQRVEKQVSENHHSNVKPTVLDGIDDVKTEVKDLRSDVTDLVAAIKVIGEMYEGHVNWSDRWVKLIEREIDNLKSN